MDQRKLRLHYLGLARLGRAVVAVSIASVLFAITSCVSFPIPPTGQDAGKWGFVDVRIQYRPNIETLLGAWKRNPDLPETSTLNQKP
jgi:hypothetical protein